MLPRAASRTGDLYSLSCRCSCNSRLVSNLPRPIWYRNLHTEPSNNVVPKQSNKYLKKTNINRKRLVAEFLSQRFTVRARYPSTTSKAGIIKTVATIPNHLAHGYGDQRQSLVILATPAFTAWLEDDIDFMSGFIQKVLQLHDDGPTFQIDVLAAVVDGLSPTVQRIHFEKTRIPAEGFAVLQTPLNDVLPNLWDLADGVNERNSSKQSSLTFLTGPGTSSDGLNDLKVTLPLANTLFKNGRGSTLLISRWRAEGKTLTKETSAEKYSQDVRITTPVPTSLASIAENRRAVPLTAPRRIVSGLGNIVRQIDLGVKGPGPASSELEENVPAYLAVAQQALSENPSSSTEGSIAVWALVVPEHLAEEFTKSSASEIDFDNEFLRKASRYRGHSNDITLMAGEPLSYWISRGATLCRVLSGGGGWGKKLGLLSLDPQTTYADVAEEDFGLLDGTPEEQEISALGNIAKPGSYIQFFTDNPERQTHSMRSNIWSRVHSDPETRPELLHWLWDTVFGTVPSTVDNRPKQNVLDGFPEKSKKSEQRQRRATKYDSLRGHFGAVSESGLFLNFRAPTSTNSTSTNSDSETPTVATKIDLPYTYVFQECERFVNPKGDDTSSATKELEPKRKATQKQTARKKTQGAFRIRKIYVKDKETEASTS